MASASAQPSAQLSEYAGPAVTVVTGDECGLLKRVVLTEGIIAKWGEQDRSQAVLCQDWVAGPSGTNLLAAAHSDGTIKGWDVSTGTAGFELTGFEGRAVAVRALATIPLPTRHRNKLMTCSDEGLLQVFNPSSGPCAESQLVEIDVGQDVEALRTGSAAGQVHVAGKEHMLATWDIGRQACVWQGKNVPRNTLDLRVDFWASDITTLADSAITDMGVKAAPTGSGQVIAASMRNKRVYVFDQRARRRPVLDLGHKHADWPFTRIASRAGEPSIWVGDTVGDVYHFDLRKAGQLTSYYGGAGSVRGLAAHPTLPLLTVAGMDRYVRVYDTRSRRLLSKVYLKQRLTTLTLGLEAAEAAASDAAVQRLQEVADSINAGPTKLPSEAPQATGELAEAQAVDDAVWAALDANAEAAAADAAGGGGSSGDSGSELDAEWGLPGAADDSDGGSAGGEGSSDEEEQEGEEGSLPGRRGKVLSSAEALVDSAAAEHRLIIDTIKAQKRSGKSRRRVASAAVGQAKSGKPAAPAKRSSKRRRRT